jgi:hypothetical protein
METTKEMLKNVKTNADVLSLAWKILTPQEYAKFVLVVGAGFSLEELNNIEKSIDGTE